MGKRFTKRVGIGKYALSRTERLKAKKKLGRVEDFEELLGVDVIAFLTNYYELVTGPNRNDKEVWELSIFLSRDRVIE